MSHFTLLAGSKASCATGPLNCCCEKRNEDCLGVWRRVCVMTCNRLTHRHLLFRDHLQPQSWHKRRLTPFVSWLLNDWHTDTYYWCVCHSHKLYIFVQFPWSSSATPPFKARFCNIQLSVCLFVFITAYESGIRATRVMFCSVWRGVPSAAGVSLFPFPKQLTRTVEVSSSIVFPSPFTLTKEQGLNVCYRVCG